MNTNALARHYHALTAGERLSLVLAAEGRGDDRELSSGCGSRAAAAVPGCPTTRPREICCTR